VNYENEKRKQKNALEYIGEIFQIWMKIWENPVI